MWQTAQHPVPCRIKNCQKYTLSHKNFAKIHCFMITLKGVLPHDTLSHNFLINCNTLSHNFYQKRTPCRIIFTVKGHPVEHQHPIFRHMNTKDCFLYLMQCDEPSLCPLIQSFNVNCVKASYDLKSSLKTAPNVQPL